MFKVYLRLLRIASVTRASCKASAAATDARFLLCIASYNKYGEINISDFNIYYHRQHYVLYTCPSLARFEDTASRDTLPLVHFFS